MARESEFSKEATAGGEPSCRRWLQLFSITFFAIFIAGLVPGQALFIPMLADWGVYHSMCKAEASPTNATQNTSSNASSNASNMPMPIPRSNLFKESGVNTTCTKQQVAMAGTFNLITGSMMFSNLVSGYLFDRFGGRCVTVAAGFFTVSGLLLLQVPLVGVLHNQDRYTSYALPFALLLTDCGNLFSQWSVISMVYHFPSHYMFLMSLILVEGQLCSIIPNIFLFVHNEMGIALPWVFGIFTIVCSISTVALYFLVPSQEEYFNEGKKVMGEMKDDANSASCYQFREICKVMYSHCCDHVFFIFAMAFFFMSITLYPSLIAMYTGLMWDDKTKGNELASLYTILTATLGVVGTLVVSFGADKAGRKAIFVLSCLCIVFNVVLAVMVNVTTYVAQLACAICSIFGNCFIIPLSMYYVVMYAPPDLLGTFNGIMWALIVAIYTVAMGVITGILANDTTYQQMGQQLFVLCSISVVLFVVWFVRMSIVGLPEGPEKNDQSDSLLDSDVDDYAVESDEEEA